MIINMSGGGVYGAGGYAAIAVSYPVGQICTCYNANRTFRAKDTSGIAVFTVNEGGTWTVAAAGKTLSFTVAKGKVYEKRLDAIILTPSELSRLAVPTSGANALTLTLSGNKIEIPSAFYNGSGIAIAGPYDITDFSELAFTNGTYWVTHEPDVTYDAVRICVWNRIPSTNAEEGLIKSSAWLSNTSHVSIPSLNVSDLTGNAYIGLTLKAFRDGSSHVQFDTMELRV